MPIPILIAGLAAGAAILGAGGHINASETNKLAEKVSNRARNDYETAKSSLQEYIDISEKSLNRLGDKKRDVFNTSISQFLIAYERVKNIQFETDLTQSEVSKFAITPAQVNQLSNMNDIYSSSVPSAVLGATAGVAIATTAGLTSGLAAGATLGAIASPLSVIAAPIILFTGISSSIEAEENLSKANVYAAEVDLAVSEMENREILCEAIADNADMFTDLLINLNSKFTSCVMLMDGVTRKKKGFFNNKKLTPKDFTKEELQLISVTRSLAGTVKSILDAPILDVNGDLTEKAQTLALELLETVESIRSSATDILKLQYDAKPIVMKKPKEKRRSKLPDATKNIFAIVIGILATYWLSDGLQDSYTLNKLLILTNTHLSNAFIFTSITLMFMNVSEISFFNKVRHMLRFALTIEFGILFYINAEQLSNSSEHWTYVILGVLVPIGICIIAGILLAIFKKILQSIFKFVILLSLCITLLSIGLLLIILCNMLSIPFFVSLVAVEILYAIGALFVLIGFYGFDEAIES